MNKALWGSLFLVRFCLLALRQSSHKGQQEQRPEGRQQHATWGRLMQSAVAEYESVREGMMGPEAGDTGS